jgi:hypothetical protein
MSPQILLKKCQQLIFKLSLLRLVEEMVRVYSRGVKHVVYQRLQLTALLSEVLNTASSASADRDANVSMHASYPQITNNNKFRQRRAFAKRFQKYLNLRLRYGKEEKEDPLDSYPWPHSSAVECLGANISGKAF